MTGSLLDDVVVGLDGSDESAVALQWAAAALPPSSGLYAVHVMNPADELAMDAVLADSVKERHRREADLAERWLAPVRDRDPAPHPLVREGTVATELLTVAREVGADAIVVGHHPNIRRGPRLVGHVTGELLKHSEFPVIIVPAAWEPHPASTAPVVVGVGVSRGTRAAIRWALTKMDVAVSGLSLVHAFGRRSIFRPDGLLDLLAFHLDPSVLPTWVEEDVTALADRIREEAGLDEVGLSISVAPGRTGPALVEAGRGARLLVIGRGEPPFVRRHAIAPYLRHALVNAPCPIAVIPAGDES